MVNGEEMPRRRREEGVSLGDVLMFIALLLFIWFLLKTLGFIDPAENLSMYILDAILGSIILAWFTDVRDLKKTANQNSRELATIKTRIDYIEKALSKLT